MPDGRDNAVSARGSLGHDLQRDEPGADRRSGAACAMLSEKGDVNKDVPVHLSRLAICSRQALIAVVMPRPKPGRHLELPLDTGRQGPDAQQLTTISRAVLARSLRISATRFVLQYADGRLCPTVILPPLEGKESSVERIGPCFWVTSSLPGVAGYCQLEMGVRTTEAGKSVDFHGQRVLIRDGPTPVAMGTLDLASMEQVKQFELRCQGKLLGVLPMTPVPTSTFTSEGGFKPAEDFTWSSAAEEQLQHKLGRLLGGK